MIVLVFAVDDTKPWFLVNRGVMTVPFSSFCFNVEWNTELTYKLIKDQLSHRPYVPYVSIISDF